MCLLKPFGVFTGVSGHWNGGQHFAGSVLQYQMAEARVRVAGVDVLDRGAYSCICVLQFVGKDIPNGRQRRFGRRTSFDDGHLVC